MLESGRAADPQSWNRYAYVLNRPLSLVDPYGLSDEDPQAVQEQQQQEPTREQKEQIKREVEESFKLKPVPQQDQRPIMTAAKAELPKQEIRSAGPNAQPATTAQPMTRMEKTLAYIGCFFGASAEHAKPIDMNPEPPKGATESAGGEQREIRAHGETRVLNPQGANSGRIDRAVGGVQYAANAFECIANVKNWPSQK